MKKTLLAAAAVAVSLSAPAFANEADMSKKIDHKFSKMDANGDGKITAAEHDAGAKKMFMDADANKDGAVTKEEMSAMMKKEHEKM